ncbi:hypothetical protein BU15DRAFT_68635, partial [Melanogaster broomeanus]
VVVTAIAYDYNSSNGPMLPVLTFPREVRYVWVSQLDIFLGTMSDASKDQVLDLGVHTVPLGVWYLPQTNLPELNVTGFCKYKKVDSIPDRTEWLHSKIVLLLSPGPFLCTILFNVANWSDRIFVGVSNLIMILRVYAMYNRSRTVLAILLASYTSSVAIAFVMLSYDSNTEITVSVILNVLLCGFAIVLFVRESLEMHRAIKQWRSNRYLELLVQGSVLYFVANLLSIVVSMVPGSQEVRLVTVLLYLFVIPPILLPARLIISMRELHSQIVSDHIDTGFGTISHHLLSTNEIMVLASAERRVGRSRGRSRRSGDFGWGIGTDSDLSYSSWGFATDFDEPKTRICTA